MSGFLEFLSNNEFTIIVCLMVIIFGLILTILIIDIFSRKSNHNLEDEIENFDDEEFDKTSMDINTSGLGMVANEALLDEIDVEAVTKNLEKTQEIEEIKYVEEDEDLEKTKALLELETIKKELAKLENQEYLDEEVEVVTEEILDKTEKAVISDVNEIDSNVVLVEEVLPVDNVHIELNKELQTSSKLSTIEDEVEKFESEQEEHAIISVEELAKVSQNITEDEIEAYEDDGNEPISIKELEEMYKSIEEQKEEDTVVETNEEKITLPDFDIKVKPAVDVYEDKNFKNTPVISPVYGVKQTESSIALEQTANLDKLNDEMKKTNEFLSTLKELRKNLD